MGSTKGNWIEAKNMDRVCLSILMEMYMRENFKMMKYRAKENYEILKIF